MATRFAARAALIIAVVAIQPPDARDMAAIDTCADNLFKEWVRSGKVEVDNEYGMAQDYDDARRYCAAVLGVKDKNRDDSEPVPDLP